MKSQIKIGTRGSKLALYQAELVKASLLEVYPSASVEIQIIKTSGDMIRRGSSAPSIETKRVYTREIEEALLNQEVDVAVHSAKDMAAVLPEGTAIGAVMKREDPRDCFLGRDQKKLTDLADGAKIGTSSLRRKKQILNFNPKFVVEGIRGNVDSRIQKMQEGHYDGIVLAYAGVKRLGLTNHVSEALDLEQFLPAPAQGIIVAQIRADDSESAEWLKLIDDSRSHIQLSCERAFLRRLEGGCQLPCGMSSVLGQTQLKVTGILFDPFTDHFVQDHLEGPLQKPEELGKKLAEVILENGGREILKKIRDHETN